MTIDTTINNGGTQQTAAGSATTINSGGVQQAGGSGFDQLFDTTINAGGQQDLYASASGTLIDGGQQLVEGGSATATIVENGGVQTVWGSATDTTVGAASEQVVMGNAVAIGALVEGGGVQQVSGATAIGTIIASGGAQYAGAGTVSGTIVENGGVQEIVGGGDTYGTILESGGLQTITSASNVYGTINSGGREDVFAQGYVSGATLYRGAVEAVYQYGRADNTTIHTGGLQIVSAGGYAVSATIDGGVQSIQSGGQVVSTTVSGGGRELVESGGSTEFATVESGGSLIVSGGGQAYQTTIDGGVVSVASGGQAFDVSFGSGGGTLTLAQPATAQFNEIFFENAQAESVIDFANASILSASIVNTNTLTVEFADGESLQSSVYVQSGRNVQLGVQSDGAGGSELVFTPTSTVVSLAQFLADPNSIEETTTDLVISDTAANIAAALAQPDDLTALLGGVEQYASGRIYQITISDNAPVALSLATLNAGGMRAVLSALQNADGSPYELAVSDTAANILTGLSSLDNYAANIQSITVSDGAPITVDVGTFNVSQRALDKIVGGFDIADAATNVARVIDALNADANIASITLTDAGTATLVLTAAQALNDTAALGKISGDNYVIALSDTDENVAANIDALNADSRITSVTLISGSAALALTVAQTLDDTTVIDEIANAGYLISVSDTAANIVANSAALSADSNVSSVKVVDTAANVAANLDALNADAQATSISLTDPGIPQLTLTTAQFVNDAKALNEIANYFEITISDTAANVAANIYALNSSPLITAITLTDAGASTLTLDSVEALSAQRLLGEITGPYSIAVSDTAADVAALIDELNADPRISSITLTDPGIPILGLTVAQALDDTAALGAISNSNYSIYVFDTAANVSANLDALNASAHVTSIAVTDGGTPTLNLTVAQTLNSASSLRKLVNINYAIAVVDTAANILGSNGALGGNTHVASVTVSDTVANILAERAALGADAEITAIVASDTAANILADGAALAADPQVSSVVVSDTAAGVAADLDALNADTQVASITLTNSGAPTLTLSVAQALDDGAALAKITNANYSIVVSDTAANIAARLDALNADARVSSIVLTDAGTPTLTLTAAQALNDTTALGEVANANYAIAVSDTAADVLANATALGGDARIASITITDENALTLSVAQATAAAIALEKVDNSGFAVTVADTAANVVANSAALLADPRISSFVVNDTASNVVAYAGMMSLIPELTAINVSDTASSLSWGMLDALSSVAALKSITLTDVGTPVLDLLAAQIVDDASTLAKITNANYTVDIYDTTTNVASYFDALNADSHIASITLNEYSPVLTSDGRAGPGRHRRDREDRQHLLLHHRFRHRGQHHQQRLGARGGSRRVVHRRDRYGGRCLDLSRRARPG